MSSENKSVQQQLDELERLLRSTGDRMEELGQAPSKIVALEEQVGKALADLGELKALPEVVAELRTATDNLRRAALFRAERSGGIRRPGQCSEAAAQASGADFILQLHRFGKLDSVIQKYELPSSFQERALTAARRVEQDVLQQRALTALTTSEVALPTEYGRELRELIADYGLARQLLTHWPIGRGTSKPPRITTGLSDFSFKAMSAEAASLSFTVGTASLESHKVFGGVLVPRELMEQGLADIGAYLMRYGSIRFAKKEDSVAFLADGTADATDDSIEGICDIASDNAYLETTAGGATAPSDVVLENFRALRRKVNAAVLGMGYYVMHITWETQLRTFKTQADQDVFTGMAVNTPRLDGFPIRWSHVMPVFGTDAAASTYPAFFGDASWWWFGEHGVPRIDMSDGVGWWNDQLGFRFIEEIDFDYQAVDAIAALKLAGA